MEFLDCRPSRWADPHGTAMLAGSRPGGPSPGPDEILAPAFTKPSFANALLVFCGWALTRSTHAITQALVELGIQGRVIGVN